MFSSPFLPLPAGLKIATTSMREDVLLVQVVSTNVRSCCPLCFCPAERRHSQYTRLVADLPCAGFRVQLILHVRRFFCDTADCIHQEDHDANAFPPSCCRGHGSRSVSARLFNRLAKLPVESWEPDSGSVSLF